jgi:hypothetical protein
LEVRELDAIVVVGCGRGFSYGPALLNNQKAKAEEGTEINETYRRSFRPTRKRGKTRPK